MLVKDYLTLTKEQYKRVGFGFVEQKMKDDAQLKIIEDTEISRRNVNFLAGFLYGLVVADIITNSEYEQKLRSIEQFYGVEQ